MVVTDQSIIANTEVFEDIKKLGAFDVSACMNCGMCTVSCPLSVSGNEFPRRLIRYAVLGLEDKLLSQPEPWLCYYCSDCSTECPSEADPGAFMAAVRRHSIIQYSVGKIGKMFYSAKTAIGSYLVLTLFAIFGLWLVSKDNVLNLTQFESYSFFGHIIHEIGIIFAALIAIIALTHMWNIWSHLKINSKAPPDLTFPQKVPMIIKSFVKVGFTEGLVEKRLYDCEHKDRYLAHMSLFWGYVLMGLATSVIFIADMIIFYSLLGPESAVIVDRNLIKLIGKILGVIGGLFLIYGSSFYMYKRLTKADDYSKNSHFTDWVFLLLSFLLGVTGFAMDIIIFFIPDLLFYAYVLYAIHLILVFLLILTAAFTKFVHMEYRLLAIWFTEYQKLVVTKVQN